MTNQTTLITTPIAPELIAAWEKLYQRGDYSAIGAICGVPHNYITRALTDKKATIDIYNGIKKFYEERSNNLKLQIKDAKALNAIG